METVFLFSNDVLKITKNDPLTHLWACLVTANPYFKSGDI